MFQCNLYAIRNAKCFPITINEARSLNEDGADIYWTPNNFSDCGKRKKEDLTEITCFFCEIDSEDKESQLKSILKNITPSSLIETKRGYHVYWYLKDPIDCRQDPVGRADWFRSFLVDRICPVFGADTQAADASRILRMPMYRYWKDKLGTFEIKIAFESDITYSLNQIEKFFPKKKVEPKVIRPPSQSINPNSKRFWDKVNAIDCRVALETLSGSHYVNGERYAFVKEGGLTRIHVNGKASNAWIDGKGNLGSTDGACPRVPNWLQYYGHSLKSVAEISKEIFGITEEQ